MKRKKEKALAEALFEDFGFTLIFPGTAAQIPMDDVWFATIDQNT